MLLVLHPTSSILWGPIVAWKPLRVTAFKEEKVPAAVLRRSAHRGPGIRHFCWHGAQAQAVLTDLLLQMVLRMATVSSILVHLIVTNTRIFMLVIRVTARVQLLLLLAPDVVLEVTLGDRRRAVVAAAT